MTVLTVGLLAAVIGIGIGYSLGINRVGVPGFGNHMMSNGATMRDGFMGGAVDQHFIIQMIPHHEGAIEMAKVALERSKRPEIITLANGIIEAQTREINDMRSWYQSWFGSAPPQGGVGMQGGGMMHMGGMTGDTSELGSVSDAEFDRAFIDQMIPHHEMAVMMASMLGATTNRAEMKTLADNIITSQSREIEMMRDWRNAWYLR